MFAAVLLACSGGGGGGKSSPPGPPGPTLDAAGRTALFQAVDTKLDSLDALDADTRHQQAVAWLRARPEVAESDVSPSGDVWAHLVDGSTVVLSDDLVDPDPSAEPPTSVAARAPAPARAAGRAAALPTLGLGIPDQLNAFVGTSLGPVFVDGAEGMTKVVDALTLRNYLLASNPTVDALKGFSDLAVLYLAAHGAVYRPPGAAALAYTLNTATQRAPDGSTDAAYQADLADGSLTFFRAKAWFPGAMPPQITRVVVWTYSITPKFVRKYWAGKFAKNAFVFINACNSGSAPATDFRAAIADAGASTYAGWTEKIAAHEAVETASYLFDRLTGASVFLPEAPPQRAFPYLALQGDMHGKTRSGKSYGYDVSQAPPDPHKVPPPPPSPQASLAFTTRDFAFGMLSPSIQSLVIDEQNAELQVGGVLGDAQGDVLVGGTKLPVKTWQAGVAVVDLPATGAQAEGPVRVILPSGQDSNDVPLTGWTGTATFSAEDNGLVGRMSLTFHFRADVHGYRIQPGQPPFYSPQTFQQAQDSSASYEFSGTYTSPDGSYTESWTGAGTLPAVTDPSAVTSGLAFLGVFDTATDTWKMGVNSVAVNGRHVHSVQHVMGGPDIVTDRDETVGGIPVFSDGTNFIAPYDASFHIDGATRTEQIPSGVGGPQPATMTLTWEAIAPVSAPGQTTTWRRRGPTRRPRGRRRRRVG